MKLNRSQVAKTAFMVIVMVDQTIRTNVCYSKFILAPALPKCLGHLLATDCIVTIKVIIK